jgi:hypothetical protein
VTVELTLDADGLAHVPTCVELGRRRLARQGGGDKGPWTIDPAGFEEMRVAMAHNAEVLKANPALSRRLTIEAIERVRKGES